MKTLALLLITLNLFAEEVKKKSEISSQHRGDFFKALTEFNLVKINFEKVQNNLQSKILKLQEDCKDLNLEQDKDGEPICVAKPQVVEKKEVSKNPPATPKTPATIK